jgi:hypothetical protein
MTFKVGDKVAVVGNPSVQGTIEKAAINDDAQFLYLVSYADEDGVLQERYFSMEKLVAA